MPWLIVHGDRGIPLGEADDPLAGLPREVGRALLGETGWAGFPIAQGWMECNGCSAVVAYDQTRGSRLTLDGDYVGMCDGPDEWWCATCYPDWLSEGKDIGSADLGGRVNARDQALRAQARANVSMHIRQASRNISRDLAEVYELVEEQVGGLLADWVEGRVSISDLRAESVDVWTRAYERAREIGRKASAVERLHPQPQILREEEEWFRSAVREEMRYWNLFLQEMLRDRRSRRFSEGRMWERFANYVKALRFMYEASRVQALPDNLLFYWMGPKDARKEKGRICKGCAFLMEHSPYTKGTLPAVPRDGSTACLTNCRHRLVVRVAHPLDVERRRRLQESSPLIRELRRLKERAHGTWRQVRARELARSLAPHVSNPFRGQRLPRNPSAFSGVPRPDERRPLTEAELLGPVPLYRRINRITENIHTTMPMRNLDLYYAARQLESQLRQGKLSRAAAQPTLDRFVAALEAVVLAAEGASKARQFESAMRSVIGRLWQAVEARGLSESDSGVVLGAAAGAV